jgi:hypothetical protein
MKYTKRGASIGATMIQLCSSFILRVETLKNAELKISRDEESLQYCHVCCRCSCPRKAAPYSSTRGMKWLLASEGLSKTVALTRASWIRVFLAS